MKSLSDNLTLKQEKFCLYYIDSGNATEAAIKAGYSENCASEIGYENLRKPQISEYIKDIRRQLSESVCMGIEERRQVLSEIARKRDLKTNKGTPLFTHQIQAIAELNRMDSIGTTQININIEDLKIAILNAKQDDTKLIAENKPKLTESTYSQKNEGGNTIV